MKRVLLIEDNIDDVEFIKKAHEPLKSKLFLDVAQDFEEAFSKMKANVYDFIVLDINLPRMNGLDILKKIRANEAIGDIPVCILTTSKFSEDIEKAYKNGCNAYIEKPFGYKDFINTVSGLLLFWCNYCSIIDTIKEKNERN